MSILLAGGAGYIGSHTAVELIKAGYDVIIVDNYDNSCPEVINRIEKITGTRPIAYEADVREAEAVRKVFSENEIDVVIHFAGLKAVGESVEKPIKYYRNNIDTTLTLLEVMEEFSCKNIVFSSSATVYGEDAPVPYIESMGRGKCTNPYGWTKNMMEQILTDAANADSEISVVLLRYFNPIGADSSGLLGEDPQGIPNNLMPYISQVAVGRREKLTIFGNDYPTEDGTCRRDYIHVSDLAEGHVKAVDYAMNNKGVEIINLGTGTPYSVLEIVNAFEDANEMKITYEFGARREGDLPEFWANADKAKELLGWEAKRTLRIFEIVKSNKSVFKPANKLQEAIGRIAVCTDAAHAFGASWHGRKVGSIADFSSFSFHAVKNLTTAEGGALTWRTIPGVDDEELYHQAQLYSLHGQSKDAFAKTKLGAWEYDIVDTLYKANMTDIMASLDSTAYGC